ncbi:MAG TPA: heat shock protein HspQ [Thiotrichaceae bacterium]|nr:heat shock protein HspQ [Thiotrichaceae bacterium]HIM07066.1 heat shock protein HspQ [Gammaproteobacteria bacterium]
MGTVTNINRAKLSIGDLIHHKLFDYRGVIVDVDQKFQSTDEWYELVAKSRPPKNKPWYHVLVHENQHSTYVAEQNLEADDSQEPIQHPLIEHYFESFEQGHYVLRNKAN